MNWFILVRISPLFLNNFWIKQIKLLWYANRDILQMNELMILEVCILLRLEAREALGEWRYGPSENHQ